ncbi:MAG: methyltransferase domain-containing protein [Candidatus Firestonebacteria bacterium]
MLNARYKYDNKSIIKLNSIQEQTKIQIESKIKQEHYKTEEVQCIICENKNFEQISEKDRFGLPMSVVICRNCGLLQTNPRMNQDAYNEFYKLEHRKLLLGKEKPTNEVFFDEYYHGQKIYQYIKKNSSINCNESFVVEIGCGTGGILAYFRDQGCKVFGIDLDEEYILFGKKNYNLNLSISSLIECPLEKSPDIVIFSHALEHLLKPDQELSRILSIMNPKGILYIEVPGIRNMVYIHNDMNLLYYFQLPHTYHFSLTTLTNLLHKNGFKFANGNEKIKSIFIPDRTSKIYKNDYNEILVYLRRLEMLRKYLPITPFKIKSIIEWIYCLLLRKTGLYNIVRTIYRQIIKRTDPQNRAK